VDVLLKLGVEWAEADLAETGLGMKTLVATRAGAVVCWPVEVNIATGLT
jgi:hypothetical protein